VRPFLATAWNNGDHHASGAGYGLKIALGDRDSHFKRDWQSVVLHLPDPYGATTVNIAKASFWSKTCREFICRDIGLWLIGSGNAPWPKHHPPKFRLQPRAPGVFEVLPPE
jgi:hypothetical protein